MKPDKPSIPDHCGFFRHIAIMVYDAAVVVSLLMLATVLAMFSGFGGRTAMRDPVFTLYLLMIWYLYLSWCWHTGGMTIGMRAWRVRIEDTNGNRPGWSTTFVRFVISLVSAALLGTGFIWSLFDRQNRSWHDIASNTRLVRQ